MCKIVADKNDHMSKKKKKNDHMSSYKVHEANVFFSIQINIVQTRTQFLNVNILLKHTLGSGGARL